MRIHRPNSSTLSAAQVQEAQHFAGQAFRKSGLLLGRVFVFSIATDDHDSVSVNICTPEIGALAVEKRWDKGHDVAIAVYKRSQMTADWVSLVLLPVDSRQRVLSFRGQPRRRPFSRPYEVQWTAHPVAPEPRKLVAAARPEPKLDRTAQLLG